MDWAPARGLRSRHLQLRLRIAPGSGACSTVCSSRWLDRCLWDLGLCVPGRLGGTVMVLRLKGRRVRALSSNYPAGPRSAHGPGSLSTTMPARPWQQPSLRSARDYPGLPPGGWRLGRQRQRPRLPPPVDAMPQGVRADTGAGGFRAGFEDGHGVGAESHSCQPDQGRTPRQSGYLRFCAECKRRLTMRLRHFLGMIKVSGQHKGDDCPAHVRKNQGQHESMLLSRQPWGLPG